MPVLTIVRGAPGSGKSTYAEKLGCFHIEADMYFQRDGIYKFDRALLGRAHTWCFAWFEFAMSSKIDVVVSNTFTKLWEFRDYITVATEHDYHINVMRLVSNYGSVHNVPQPVIDRMLLEYEPFTGEQLIQ